jgi:hypothetical protein
MSSQRKKSSPSDGGSWMPNLATDNILLHVIPHPEYHAPPQKRHAPADGSVA